MEEDATAVLRFVVGKQEATREQFELIGEQPPCIATGDEIQAGTDLDPGRINDALSTSFRRSLGQRRSTFISAMQADTSRIAALLSSEASPVLLASEAARGRIRCIPHGRTRRRSVSPSVD
jgi:hypothetical protein